VTLSIAGLGWLDETELETIPQRQIVSNDPNPLLEEVLQIRRDRERASLTLLREKHPRADEVTKLSTQPERPTSTWRPSGNDMRAAHKAPREPMKRRSPTFLCEQMTMSQYNTARAHYSEALRLILEEDVPDHKPQRRIALYHR